MAAALRLKRTTPFQFSFRNTDRMDGIGDGVSVYAEAKGEYTKQMCQYLVPALHKYFLDLLEEAKTKEPEQKKLLLQFQALLEAIPEWNMDKVQRETGVVQAASQCDYLEELLAAVFIAHTKVLSAIRLTTKQKKLQITIPRLEHFLHRTMTECARILWSNTYLFSPTAPSLERQRALRQIETLLQDGVLQSIRSMLPVKNILREYLHSGGAESEEDEDEEEIGADEHATGGADGTAPAKAEEAPAASPEHPATPATTPVPAGSPPEPIAAPAAVDPPILVVDTSVPPTTPPFSGEDTGRLEETGLLEEEPPIEEEDEEAEEGDGGSIQIADAPPEPIDDFEDLEKPSTLPETDELPMDFEELA